MSGLRNRFDILANIPDNIFGTGSNTTQPTDNQQEPQGGDTPEKGEEVKELEDKEEERQEDADSSQSEISFSRLDCFSI